MNIRRWRWGPFVHVFLYQIFRCRSRPVLSKGTRDSMHSSRGSLALPNALTQSRWRNNSWTCLQVPFFVLRIASVATQKALQLVFRKASDVSRTSRWEPPSKLRRDWNRFDGQMCEKKKKKYTHIIRPFTRSHGNETPLRHEAHSSLP